MRSSRRRQRFSRRRSSTANCADRRLHRRTTRTASESSRSAGCCASTTWRSPRAPTTPSWLRVRVPEPTGTTPIWPTGCWTSGGPTARLYGAEKLWTAALDGGIHVGRDQVARLMRILGIEGVRRRGRHRTTTTVADPKAPRHPDLINRAWGTPTRPGPVVGGRLHLRVDPGRVRLRQLRHRRVLPAHPGLAGIDVQDHPAGAVRLEQALFTRRRTDVRFTSTGLVYHSDAGQPIHPHRFTEALIDAGIAASIGTVGDALDNALHGIDHRPVQDGADRPRADCRRGPAQPRSSARRPAGCTGTTRPASISPSVGCRPSASSSGGPPPPSPDRLNPRFKPVGAARQTSR